MGINAQDVIAQDPDMLRKQLYQREMQQLNPSGDVFGTIGALLGRGIANKSQGRGFFDVADPALQRVAKMNAYQQEAMQLGGGDTVKTLELLKSKLIEDRELAPLAVKVDEELTKAKKGIFETTRLEQADKRAERALQIQETQAMETKYKNNPELLLEDALKLPDDSPEKNAMLTRYSRITKERNYSIAQKDADLAQARANLLRTQAETERIRKQAEKEGDAGIMGKPGSVGKGGAYRDTDGQIYAPTEIAKVRSSFNALGRMLDTVSKITDDDVNNAESMFDFTEGIVPKGVSGTMAAKTVGAQTKVAASQLLDQIKNLPPGSASNADMVAAAKSFPGYGSATNLRNWVNSTKATLEKYYQEDVDKFGFKPTAKATPALTGKKSKTSVEGAQTGEWKIVN